MISYCNKIVGEGVVLDVQKWVNSVDLLFIRYLVGVSAAVSAHSLLQLLIGISRLLRKSPVIPSRNHAWLIFAGDQVEYLFSFLKNLEMLSCESLKSYAFCFICFCMIS